MRERVRAQKYYLSFYCLLGRLFDRLKISLLLIYDLIFIRERERDNRDIGIIEKEEI